MNEQTICTPADERAPLNCNTSSEAVSKICYCSSGEQELFQLAKRGSNMCLGRAGLGRKPLHHSRTHKGKVFI